MMKMTIRLAALTAALMFGVATAAIAADTAAPADQSAPAAPAKTMHHAHHMMHHHHHHAMHAGSKEVSAAQDALNKEGANLKVDGKYGPKTRAAIKSYQKAHGLKATGHLDGATKAALKVS